MFTANVSNTKNSFSQTINNQAKVSYGIEKASEDQEYVNNSLLHYENSEMKLNLRNNLLLTKYFDKIKRTATKLTLTRAEQFKYNNRPELLSSDNYGTPELWYIILKLNSCEDFSDFRDLNEVIMPDLSTIQNCITNDEYIKSKDAL